MAAMSLAPGTTFMSYEIVALLGSGGMGEVYRARDRKLGRDVAIKVLPSADAADAAAAARLVREAQTASQLNHPNICTIFDANTESGRLFIVMELVEGVTLSQLLADGPLGVDRAVRYAGQLADALTHAHQRGIVHRDLKSANVMITPDGRAKILDFGLAKRAAANSETSTVASLTDAGSIVGTVAYMAPEVLRGSNADARSDLWSLGVIMFELLAGGRPFRGSSAFELTSFILTSPLPPLPTTVPQGIGAIVNRLLAKAAGERYQQAAELKAALDAVEWSGRGTPVAQGSKGAWRTAALVAAAAAVLVMGWAASSVFRDAAPPRPQIHAIAVLPLTSMSGDASQEPFTDGITEALIADLARVSGLDVISRTSAMHYKNSTKRLTEIARELDVDAVVQGSVTRVGDRVRVSAQLIDAATDRHLWSEEYDRDVRDILVLQRDVARAVARQVTATLSTAPPAAAAETARRVAPEAYDRYLRAKALILRFNERSIAAAIKLLEEAIQIEPEFAGAWAALASAHSERGIWGEPPSSRETGARAREAIVRAIALDPGDAEAQAILGNISMVYDWDWVAAERALDRSVELAAGGGVRNLRTSLFWALGRSADALAEAERFRRLDPASVSSISLVGRAQYRARQFDAAIATFREAIAFDPTHGPNYARLADVYIAIGKYDAAIAEIEQGQRIGASRRQLDGLATAYAMAGRRREAQAIRRDLVERGLTDDQVFYSLAMIDTALGDKDAAFGWLNRAYDAHSANLWLLASELKLEALRSDPRFADLARRMRIPGY